MKKLSTFEWGAIVCFVIITCVGGYFYFDSSSKLDSLKQQASDLQGKLTQVLQRRSTPSEETIKILDQNNQVLEKYLNSVREKMFRSEKLSKVQDIDVLVFKSKTLVPAIHQLRLDAKAHNVELPPGAGPTEFYFSFGRLRSETPKSMRSLAKQLIGVEEISKALFNSGGIFKLLEIHRGVSVEAGDSEKTSGGREESLKGVVIDAPFYKLYPFEYKFAATTDGLRNFLNKLITADHVFIVRTIEVENESQEPAKRDTVIQKGQKPSDDPEKPTKKTEYLAVGDQKLIVTARIDMLEWKHQQDNTPGGKK
jgi:hypothetical protein